MNMLDPKLGGKVRAVITILSFVAIVLTAVAGSFTELAWVASALTAVRALIAGLTHFTDTGNAE